MKLKLSPKAQVTMLAHTLYPGRDIIVLGHRPRPRGGKKRPFTVQIIMNGKIFMTAQERDPRTAYKTLQIKLSKGSIL